MRSELCDKDTSGKTVELYRRLRRSALVVSVCAFIVRGLVSTGDYLQSVCHVPASRFTEYTYSVCGPGYLRVEGL